MTALVSASLSSQEKKAQAQVKVLFKVLSMIQNAKLLAFDLDGTLLNSRKEIGERSAKAIRFAISQGVIVILASGRMHSSMVKYCNQLGIPPDMPVISYNGAMVRTLGGKLIYERPVPAQLAKYVVDYTAEHDLHLNFYHGDKLYIRKLEKWSDLYLQRVGSKPNAIGDFSRFDGISPTKLIIIDTFEKTNSLLAPMREHFGDKLYITKTDDEYLEFMSPSATKGLALEAVANDLHIAQADCAAFGDNYNDLPMLKWVGWPVGMANAKPEVHKIASEIANDVEEDGVGQLLEKAYGVTQNR